MSGGGHGPGVPPRSQGLRAPGSSPSWPEPSAVTQTLLPKIVGIGANGVPAGAKTNRPGVSSAVLLKKRCFVR